MGIFNLYKTLEEVDSLVNGKIQVIRTMEGVRILVGGVSQSGWLVKKIWKTVLAKINKGGFVPRRVLILGLGGGSVAEVVCDFWNEAEIVGLDKDPKMITLGKKYLNLSKIKNLEILIDDAWEFLSKKGNGQFDLILVDLYKGGKIPVKFRSIKFMQGVYRKLAPGGIAAFNHLYSSIEKKDAEVFDQRVGKVFPVVVTVQPEANVIFLGYRS